MSTVRFKTPNPLLANYFAIVTSWWIDEWCGLSTVVVKMGMVYFANLLWLPIDCEVSDPLKNNQNVQSSSQMCTDTHALTHACKHILIDSSLTSFQNQFIWYVQSLFLLISTWISSWMSVCLCEREVGRSVERFNFTIMIWSGIIFFEHFCLYLFIHFGCFSFCLFEIAFVIAHSFSLSSLLTYCIQKKINVIRSIFNQTFMIYDYFENTLFLKPMNNNFF